MLFDDVMDELVVVECSGWRVLLDGAAAHKSFHDGRACAANKLFTVVLSREHFTTVMLALPASLLGSPVLPVSFFLWSSCCL